jgi:hypothetical protein
MKPPTCSNATLRRFPFETISFETMTDMRKVYYKLDGDDRNHSIKLPEDEATIEVLKSAVKKKWPNVLRDVDKGELRVFVVVAAAAAAAAQPNSNNELDNERKISELDHSPTTSTNALIVSWPQPQPLQLFKLVFR